MLLIDLLEIAFENPNYLVRVNDGEEEYTVTTPKMALEYLRSVDEATLLIGSAAVSGVRKWAVFYIVNGLAPEEELADHSCNGFTQQLLGKEF